MNLRNSQNNRKETFSNGRAAVRPWQETSFGLPPLQLRTFATHNPPKGNCSSQSLSPRPHTYVAVCDSPARVVGVWVVLRASLHPRWGERAGTRNPYFARQKARLQKQEKQECPIIAWTKLKSLAEHGFPKRGRAERQVWTHVSVSARFIFLFG